MNIELSKIKPSPAPIRTTWDEDKLQELAQSIQEQGLIVPIKVRPTDNSHYEIVYGHRRVEAMRLAGIDETDAIVEGVDDTTTLLQAGMENLSKEDMTAFDKGAWISRILPISGWTLYELAKQSGISRNMLSYWLTYYEEASEGLAVNPTSAGDGLRHTMEIKKSLSDPKDKRAVADKVEEEGLTWKQTRQVAESVAATKDPAMRQRLIDAPYSPYTHDPEYAKERADRYGEHDPMARDKTPALDEAWKLTAEVSMIVDFIKKSRQMYQEIIKMDELGKFSPEARPFLIGKLKGTINQIEKVITRLEE